ncbi:hypothetical protein FRB95_001721 [Tulasnella sp. JGI-2019a]|nr:hypothetical protein FRB95_001721 [Tulasnella sp. JGI-2019a]
MPNPTFWLYKPLSAQMSSIQPHPAHPSVAPTTGDVNPPLANYNAPTHATSDMDAIHKQASIDHAGNKVGGAIKGTWNAFHGAGEALRGNIIKGADSITGSGGDETTLGANPVADGGTVAESGFAEMNRGIQGLKGNPQ